MANDLIDLIQHRLDKAMREEADTLAAGNASDFGAYRAGAGRHAGLGMAKEIVRECWRDWGKDGGDD